MDLDLDSDSDLVPDLVAVAVPFLDASGPLRGNSPQPLPIN